ncbi:hypothetical protein PND86_23160, partial [Flavonifractor plautii]
ICLEKGATPSQSGEFGQTWSFRGTKSRNKVSVGEPAEGSLKKFNNFENGFFFFCFGKSMRAFTGQEDKRWRVQPGLRLSARSC